MHREMQAGKGYADIIFIPRKNNLNPAIIVELKWDKSAETAMEQIKEKNYPDCFKDYKGDVLLVGINYDKDSKEHSCKIEKINIV
jgi:RecB family endonuclease NucS